VNDQTPAPISRFQPLVGGFAGGLFFGLGDAMAVMGGDALNTSQNRDGLLMLIDGISLGLVGAVALLPLLILPRPIHRLMGATPTNASWWGFCWALSALMLLDFSTAWMTAPPPFQEAPPLHGDPAVIVGLALALSLAAMGFARGIANSRVRAGVVAGLFAISWMRFIGSARELPSRGFASESAPNVLVVSIDTIRADTLRWDGHPEIQTPNYTRLVEGGVAFTQAQAQIAVTGPSHTTLHSGQTPWEHGALLNGVPVNPEVPWLAEIFRAEGYRTGAFVSAYVLEGALGFSRGFEVYDDDFSWLQGWSGSLPGRMQAMIGRHMDPHHVLERRGGRTVDAALSWLGGLRGPTPFFAWVHLFDPHGPYEPPPPWDTAYHEGDPRDPTHTSMAQVENVAAYLAPSLQGITDVDWVLAQYAGEVSYTDGQLGRLLDWLDDSQNAQDTLVLVVGDHGELLGEHRTWFNHGDHLYEAELAVPMAMRLPGIIPAGARVDAPVEITDVAPTILEILGIAAPVAITGRSMVPAMAGERGRAYARAMCFDREANLKARKRGEITAPVYRMVALRGPTTRYIYREAAGYGEVLYDLASEAGETRPVEADSAVMDVLRRQATAILQDMSTSDVARSSSEIDPETRAKLEMLGYIE
jgi:arylsulfatase A-like enzyme